MNEHTEAAALSNAEMRAKTDELLARLGEAIRRIHTGQSVGALFNGH